MNSVPLLGHASLDDVFAWRPDGPVRVRDFLAEVEILAAQLPAGNNLLNVCQDRYRFTVGFAAGLISAKTSLQPASQSAETLRQIQRSCPDVFCLCDDDFDTLDLPRLDFPAIAAPQGHFLRAAVNPEKVAKIPLIPAEQIAACLFTSGSTGRPAPHSKTWGRLVKNGRAEAARLGLLAQSHSIVGTVPAQHSYGFESTVLLALHGNSPFWSGRPFYPQDIVGALNAVPPPRLLVTTPFHLAALLEADLELPALDLLLSATAPLSGELASQAERRCHAPLYEIYGSTESGQLASRRTTAGPSWELLADVELDQAGELTTELRVPVPDRPRRAAYAKWTVRKSIDFPLVSVALCFDLERDEVDAPVLDATVVVGVLGAKPRVVSGLEAAIGKKLSDPALARLVADAVHKQCKPLENVPFEAPYRRQMLAVYTRRAIEALVAVG